MRQNKSLSLLTPRNQIMRKNITMFRVHELTKQSMQNSQSNSRFFRMSGAIRDQK